ncbi:MAG: hypothetical protein HY078_10475 [Elusimicrobia bacterium]|nr:hypothetical protein [Elusimicrobiota bacterium]
MKIKETVKAKSVKAVRVDALRSYMDPDNEWPLFEAYRIEGSVASLGLDNMVLVDADPDNAIDEGELAIFKTVDGFELTEYSKSIEPRCVGKVNWSWRNI